MQCLNVKMLILPLLLIFSFLTPVGTLSAEENSVENSVVYLAQIEGEIKAGTHQYLKRAIKAAEKEANYLIIKLDTPGGLVKPTKDIVDLILATPVKTIVFVHKEGGWAYSAGTFILLAADYAISHPGASIGAAEPRAIIGGKAEADPKIVEGMATWLKSLAEKNQRNSEVAEKFVRENLTLTGKEAKELGVIDETAKNLEEIFLKLEIYEPKIKEIFPSPIEKFFDILSHPYLISLFLTLGGLGLIFAFRTGEFELSGILGLIFLLIGLWGMGIIQFSILGIFLILVGISLLIVEIFQPGLGVFGALGIISLVLGVFTLEAEPFFYPKIFEATTMIVLGALITICILFVIIGRWVAKDIKEKPKTGSEALIGEIVEVLKTLEPLGQVEVKGEIWQAKSLDGRTIPKGTKVEIIKVEGNTLIVKILNPKSEALNPVRNF